MAPSYIFSVRALACLCLASVPRQMRSAHQCSYCHTAQAQLFPLLPTTREGSIMRFVVALDIDYF